MQGESPSIKKKYHKTMCVSLLLLVLIVSVFAGCSTDSTQSNNTTVKANQPVSNTNNQANQSEKPAASFIN
jgi:outer membrane PBP1 activator LpoA protein